MTRISKTFLDLRKKKEGALIGYLTAGDPDTESSKKLLRCLSKNVDILEIGLPWSDPIADGPTIQTAMDRALLGGFNTDKGFKILRELRDERIETPFVIMTYYNIVLQYGEVEFINACSKYGVDGLLISDLPIEESKKMVDLCRKNGVDLIFLIAPNTPSIRVKKIVRKARGFIYLVSLLGVTGERDKIEERTLKGIKSCLRYTSKTPLAVGFGISKKEHVKSIIDAGASGVVVGSAFVNLVSKYGKNACPELERLSSELKEGTR